MNNWTIVANCQWWTVGGRIYANILFYRIIDIIAVELDESDKEMKHNNKWDSDKYDFLDGMVLWQMPSDKGSLVWPMAAEKLLIQQVYGFCVGKHT